MDQVKKDKRFAHIVKDSRFHKMPSKFRKVRIDNRFKSMFSDKRFKTKYQVDKRGKPVKTSTNENLKDYYELDSSDDDWDGDDANRDIDDESGEDEDVKSPVKVKESIKSKTNESSNKKQNKLPVESIQKSADDDDGDSDDSKCESNSSDEDFESASQAIKQGIDLARGEGDMHSSSDEDQSDDSGLDDNEYHEVDHKWGELEADATEAKEVTSRLALCNMDWDRIKAQDILVLMNSFKPQGGIIHNVKIYPSKYGLKRIEEDSRLGPAELRSAEKHDSDDSSDEEDSAIQQEKLRQYQINRLKYYYAVITCDSPQTADAIYEQCDGIEYETSSSRIDLRFIPDDMEFDHEPTSTADRVLDGVNYKPASFVTTALNQTKVNLTWEETDPDRLKQTMRKFSKDEVDEMDLKAYLASDSDHDEDDDEKIEVNKFRSLLGDEGEQEKVEDANMEMEISWEPGLKEATEKAVKNKSKGGQTPWEKYLEKRSEKKHQKLDEKMKMKAKQEQKDKLSDSENDNDDDHDDDVPEGVDLNDPYFKDAFSDDDNYKKPEKLKKKKRKKGKSELETGEADPDLDLLVMDEDDHKQHFSLEQIMKSEQKKKKKNKKKDIVDTKPVEDTFRLNLDDERFAAMYTSSAYNVDPSAKDYKKTKAMEAIVSEKIRRRTQRHLEGPVKKAAKVDGAMAEESSNTESIQSLVKSVKAKAKMSKPSKKGK